MLKVSLISFVFLSFAPETIVQRAPAGPSIPAQRVQLSDGRHLALYCQGTGSPAVIFDSGLGLDGAVWARVQPEVSRMTRACSFDRAGYGGSDEGPAPRDATHIVADLRAALEVAGIDGPYVLVGHSMGGYDMRLFANLYTTDVMGMVLVDPSIDGNLAPLAAVSPAFVQEQDVFEATAGKCIRAAAHGEMRPGYQVYTECGSPPLDSPMANPAMARAVLPEQASLDDSSRQVLASEIGSTSLPLIVLSAGIPAGANWPPEERDAVRTVVLNNHARIAATSSCGVHRIVDGAPHVIQMARPDAVVAAITEILNRVC